MSMLVGLVTMIAVCVELMLRNRTALFGRGDDLAAISDAVTLAAEGCRPCSCRFS